MNDLKHRLYMTFIQDDRYLFFLSGLKTTLILTFASFLLGVAFGALLTAMSRSESSILRKAEKAISYFLVEIPTMVLLMVMVYIIFGASAAPVLVIVIVGLTMKTGAFLAEIFRTALDSVSDGEREAALTLAMSKWQTFRYVVLPQGMRAAMPLVKNQFVYTMQETSIVGYLAVMDLTRAYSVVSARTMDAILGLVAVTLAYFVIGSLIKALLSLLVRDKRGAAA